MKLHDADYYRSISENVNHNFRINILEYIATTIDNAASEGETNICFVIDFELNDETIFELNVRNFNIENSKLTEGKFRYKISW